MRLFVAAGLPDDLRRRLAGLQQTLRALPIRARWVAPASMHLTLRFIGEVAPERLAGVREAVGRGVAGAGGLRLQVRGVGTFPERGRPRVIWVGLAGDVEAARGLSLGLDAALREIGFPAEERPFRPHLTLARITEASGSDWRGPLETQAGFDGGGFEVTAVVLFESRLQAAGPIYHPLMTCDLGGGAGS